MALNNGNGLAGRIVDAEMDSLQRAIKGVDKSLQEISDSKEDDAESRKCLARRIRRLRKRVADLHLIKEQVPAGDFRFALFHVMKLMHEYERQASSRRITDDLQKIAEDLQKRIANYEKALEYGKIANELYDLVSCR